MNSTHIYRAYLVGSPDVELSVEGGSITLDATRTPHIAADLQIASPGEATLVALDPRETPRVRVEVEAQWPTATQNRFFDLGLRDRSAEHNGSLTLRLASDEALLEDYAPLADDDTTFGLASSLRDVVDYVLDETIPGARLTPYPPQWGLAHTGFSGGTGVYTEEYDATDGPPGIATYQRKRWVTLPTSVDGQGYMFTGEGWKRPAVAGETLTFSYWWRTSWATGATDFNNIWIWAYDAAGNIIESTGGSRLADPAPNVWRQDSRTYTTPAGTVQLQVMHAIYFGSGVYRPPVNGTFDAAGLEVSGGTLHIDADVTPYWPVTSLHTNPEVVNTYGFGAGEGASSLTRVTFGALGACQWTTAAGISNLVFTPAIETFKASPGKWYVATINVNSAVARQARVGVQWYANDGTAPMGTVWGEFVTTVPGSWTTVVVIARAPAGASSLVPFVSTEGNAAGQAHYARLPMVYEGNRAVPPFTGNTPDDANYEYAWAESEHGSPSVREPVNDSPDPGALVWRAGVSAIDFLHSLVQASGFRLVCDEKRRWTLRDENHVAPGQVAIRHAINMINGSDQISRDSGLWFDARVTRYKWTDADGVRQEQVDSFALNDPYTRLTTLDVDAPYPGPGRSEYAVRRAQGRGREVTVTAVSDWRAQAEQGCTFVLDEAPTQIGISDRVEFSLDNDEMTVTARTADIPDGAIDLLTGTIDALTGTIDSLS